MSATIVVCITGASGSAYARRALSLLAEQVAAGAPLNVHWIASANAPQVWQHELGEPMPEELPHTKRWDRFDFFAPFASGSNPPTSVMVMPCSMSTIARVANGGSDDLIGRVCEVALKERRKLLLLARETPLSLVHLRNMVAVTEAGATVMPAVPAFYATKGGPPDLANVIDTVVSRALDHGLAGTGVEVDLGLRWGDER